MFEEICEASNLEPTETGRYGERYGDRPNQTNKIDYWRVHILKYGGYGISEGVQCLRSLIGRNARSLKELCNKNGWDTEVSFVVWLGLGYPALHLERPDIEILHELGCSLDVDILGER